MERKVKEVIFLAPNINYALKVRTNLAAELDKVGISYRRYEAGGTILIRTDKVNVEFVFTDPVRWTRDMFMRHDAILGKRELIDTLNDKFNAGLRYNSSLSKYIRDLHAADAPEEDPNSRTSYLPEITNVYFNDPVTVVMWDDGTKTVVKCQDGDVYSEETGLSLCITKKALGNMGNFNNIFRKWVPDHEVERASLKARMSNLSKLASDLFPTCKYDFKGWGTRATAEKEEPTNG